ncbi:MAG TPA: alpha-L-glutamate ligase [Anaeromyxobacteraceae bacterium]|nr:alpha-L-glutamate ligase [Anaeromyxobacteraceae bacterium]
MILAISHAEDVHAPPVLEALARMGEEAVLLDLASLPRERSISISHGRAARGATFAGAGGALRAEEVRAVWWRRPRRYVPHAELAPEHAAYAVDQVHAAVSGVWASLDAGWVNDPWLDERASHKPAQLAAAEAAGLDVPPTLVTSDPDDARAFLEELRDRPVVNKPLKATEATFRPTQLVGERDRRRLGDLRFGPAILQGYVPGVDVRVTAVGGRLFAASIDARATTSPHDFRQALASARVEPCDLPRQVEEGLRGLMRRLGLRYAAIDLRRDEEGRHFFLEANPAGQWLFVEARTGQPITLAVAESLVEAAREVTDGDPGRQEGERAVRREAGRSPWGR